MANTPSALRVAKHRAKKKEEKLQMLKERADLFGEFVNRFRGLIRISFIDVDQTTVDIDDKVFNEPIQVRMYFDDAIRPAMATFASERGLTPQELIDHVMAEVCYRAEKRGMIPGGPRHLVN